jgi:hypothetical protein
MALSNSSNEALNPIENSRKINELLEGVGYVDREEKDDVLANYKAKKVSI